MPITDLGFGVPDLPKLSVSSVQAEAATFADIESKVAEPRLFGVTDGKAVGTYLEKKFTDFLLSKYQFPKGNSASGIDLPDIGVDIKVTSITQPQSSCPYKSARQKIFGLGYSLLIFVYEKTDDQQARTGRLNILHTIFVEKHRTADFTMTRSIAQILDAGASEADLVSLIQDRNLPVDEIEAINIAKDILSNRPGQGYLTISNALQWRLQYSRAITSAGTVEGVLRIR